MVIKTYVARPVTIHAIEWTGHNFPEIRQFCNGMARMENGGLIIETVNGSSRAFIGDSIAYGTQGEFYPIGKAVMEAKYDEVRE